MQQAKNTYVLKRNERTEKNSLLLNISAIN